MTGQQQQKDVFTGGAGRACAKIGHHHVRFIRQLIPKLLYLKGKKKKRTKKARRGSRAAVGAVSLGRALADRH